VAGKLVRLGYLEAGRGRGGGIRLAQPPASLRLGEFVRRVEPRFDLVECFREDGTCTVTSACRLKGVLSQALEAFFRELDRHTLADLLENRVRLGQLLSRSLETQPSPRAGSPDRRGRRVSRGSRPKPARP